MPLPLLLQAIPWIASGVGSLASLFGAGRPNPREQAQDQAASVQELLRAFPQLRESMDLQLGQMRRQDPVHQAALQMALNLAPNSAFATNYPNRPNLSQPQYGGTGESPFPGEPPAGAPRAVRRRSPR